LCRGNQGAHKKKRTFSTKNPKNWRFARKQKKIRPPQKGFPHDTPGYKPPITKKRGCLTRQPMGLNEGGAFWLFGGGTERGGRKKICFSFQVTCGVFSTKNKKNNIKRSRARPGTGCKSPGGGGPQVGGGKQNTQVLFKGNGQGEKNIVGGGGPGYYKNTLEGGHRFVFFDFCGENTKNTGHPAQKKKTSPHWVETQTGHVK